MEGPSRITGEVALTEQDLYAAFSRLAPFRRRWWYLASATLLSVTALVGGSVALRDLAAFLTFASLFLAFLFLWPLYMAQRTLAAMPDKIVRYEIEGEQVTIRSRESTLTRRWDRIIRFREERSAFLIWVGPYAIQVIPKRAFSDEGVGHIRAILSAIVTPLSEVQRAVVRRRIVIFSVVLVLLLAGWEFWAMKHGAY